MNIISTRGWFLECDRLTSDHQGPFLLGLDFFIFDDVSYYTERHICIGYTPSGKCVWLVKKDDLWFIYQDLSSDEEVRSQLTKLPERGEKTLKFVEKAWAKRGKKKWDYSKVIYVNPHDHVEIGCRTHGFFKQSPANHLRGRGCAKCRNDKLRINNSMGTKGFIKKAVQKYGNRYGYSLVEYVNMFTKVKIICFDHGEFDKTPNVYLRGAGCPKCPRAKNDPRIITKEKFIERSNEKYNGTYDYSKVEFKGMRIKVLIGCLVHGTWFWQIPESHSLGKRGCKKCKGEQISWRQMDTLELFLTKAAKIRGNLYDYSRVEINSPDKKVEIICRTHGSFYQKREEHLQGKGCPKCAGKNITNKEFLKKARDKHGETYDYPDEYVLSSQKLRIICFIHGEFFQTPTDHLRGNGCRLCGLERSAKARTKTHKDFVIQATSVHDGKYSYPETYVNDITKITIVCPTHGPFTQVPDYHLQGCGCPRCQESKGERETSKVLKKYGVPFETQKRFPECKHLNVLPFDFYVESLNLLIEYDGEQHFSPVKRFGGKKAFKLVQYRDSIKTKFAEDNGYILLRIRYDENIEEKLLPFLE